MKFFMILILMISDLVAQAPLQTHSFGKTARTGDSPPQLFDSRQGNYGYLVLPIAYNHAKAVTDSFSLDSLPSGAQLSKAWYVVTDWRSDSSLVSAKVMGAMLPTDTVFYDSAGGSILSTFTYDVTSKFSDKKVKIDISGLNNSYLTFLYMVYEDASLPAAQIDFFLGSEALLNDSSTVIIQNPQDYKGVKIAVLTEAADNGSSNNENFLINGNPIAENGLYYGNIGNFADFYTFDSLTVPAGTSRLTLTTGQDYFGYHALIYSHHFNAVSALANPADHAPSDFELLANYPNPFNPSTTIRYRLKSPSRVKFAVFDITGKRVDFIDLGKQAAGAQHFTYNAAQLGAGIYFYRITVDGVQKTRKMVLLR